MKAQIVLRPTAHQGTGGLHVRQSPKENLIDSSINLLVPSASLATPYSILSWRLSLPNIFFWNLLTHMTSWPGASDTSTIFSATRLCTSSPLLASARSKTSIFGKMTTFGTKANHAAQLAKPSRVVLSILTFARSRRKRGRRFASYTSRTVPSRKRGALVILTRGKDETNREYLECDLQLCACCLLMSLSSNAMDCVRAREKTNQTKS